MWAVKQTDDYVRCHKWYAKKKPHETAAVLDNAEAYEKALNAGANPLQLCGFGYVHNERGGVYAVDQSHSGSKRKLAQTRLYLYPEVVTKTLYLLRIGDKNEQSKDVAACHDFVALRKQELENESHDRDVQKRQRFGPEDNNP